MGRPVSDNSCCRKYTDFSGKYVFNLCFSSNLRQIDKANTSDTEAPILDFHLSISNGFVSSKIYDKRDEFDFDIVNFSFLDGDVSRSTSYGVYISQLIRFARVSSHVADFNARNKSLFGKELLIRFTASAFCKLPSIYVFSYFPFGFESRMCS